MRWKNTKIDRVYYEGTSSTCLNKSSKEMSPISEKTRDGSGPLLHPACKNPFAFEDDYSQEDSGTYLSTLGKTLKNKGHRHLLQLADDTHDDEAVIYLWA